MSTAFEIYRATAVNAQRQFEADKAAAKARRDATVSSIYQAVQIGSVNYENVLPTAMPGFPMGGDSSDTFATVQAALAAADAQLASDLLAAEGKRQGVVGTALDLANTLANSGADPF
jgi:hypothetical protein